VKVVTVAMQLVAKRAPVFTIAEFALLALLRDDEVLSTSVCENLT
jgi:hypothetical protein